MTQKAKPVQFRAGNATFKAEVTLGRTPKLDRIRVTQIAGHISQAHDFIVAFWKALLEAVSRIIRAVTKAETPLGTNWVNPADLVREACPA